LPTSIQSLDEIDYYFSSPNRFHFGGQGGEMNEEKTRAQAPKKKSKVGCCIGLSVFGLLLLGVVFYYVIGPFGLGLDLFGNQAKMDKVVDEALQRGAERQYTYAQPSTQAKTRTVDCSKLFKFSKLPRNNPLCVNLYNATAQDLQTKIDSGKYDRIVVYGDNIIMDAPSALASYTDMGTRIYNVAKFSDLVTLPKLMGLFGISNLKDMSFGIAPYKAIFYRVSTLEEGASVCGIWPDGEKISSCAIGDGMTIISDRIIAPEDNASVRFNAASAPTNMYYFIKFPTNCYTDDIFIHETTHNLISYSGQVPKWFNEQTAGFVGRVGPEEVCGANTLEKFRTKVDGKEVKNYTPVKFLGIFPAAETSHDYPESTCNQGVLTQWYRYLNEGGNWPSQFKTFFTDMRNSNPAVDSDAGIKQFLLSEDKDSQAATFVNSKCQ